MRSAAGIFRAIEIVALAACVISVFYIMLKAAGWELSSAVLHLWAILPYIVFFIISSIVSHRKRSSIVHKAASITSVLMLAVSLTIYIDGMFIHATSTSFLLFMFVPFYLLFGGPLIFAIILHIWRRVE